MKSNFICYFDMDGVVILFEKDKDARKNMWLPGYFENIPTREGICEILQRINRESSVILLTKIIQKLGTTKEKINYIMKDIPTDAWSDIIFVPYGHSKSEYILQYYPSMIVDDKEENLEDCEKKGCHPLFLSDLKISQKYENAKSVEDIWTFYQKIKKIYE